MSAPKVQINKGAQNGFDESGIRMNTWIAKKDKWTLAELEERSQYLVGKALSIWASPVTEYKPEEKQLDTYTLEDEGELTGRLIAKFTFKNTEQPVTSWVEMFQKVIQILYAEDKSIITKLALSEEENIALHFNTNPDSFNKSLEIGDGIYVWTNTSTQSKLSVLSRLFKLYMDARIPDNAGVQPVDVPVQPDGPAAYFSTLPVKAITRCIQDRGIPCQLSCSAGTYVCNCVLYQALHMTHLRYPHIRAGFIHVPFSDEQAAAKPDRPASLPLVVIMEALVLAVEAIAENPQDTHESMGSIF